MGTKPILNITPSAFSKYGTVLTFTDKCVDGFEIVVRAENTGWRIALLEFSRKTTKVVENHPHSKESFEPISGMSLLMVAENSTPEEFEVFLLDQPICLNEGVWHQVISLSEVSKVKITENLEVECEYHQLQNEVSPFVLY